MNKFILPSVFVLAILSGAASSVEAQRVRTIQSIVSGSTYEHAMNICKKGSGGNVIIAMHNKIDSYECHFDINVAKSQREYDINKKRQEYKKPKRKRIKR